MHRAEGLVGLPLNARNRIVGALVLHSPRETASTYLEAIATHAALAVDRALFHESEARNCEDLDASGSRFRCLVQGLDAVFWECDPVRFRFSFVSDRAEKVLGHATARWLEPGFWASILHPEDQHWALDFCVECTKEGRDDAFEYRMMTADGRVRWFRDVVHVIRDAEGKPVKLRGLMLDITHERESNPQGRVPGRLRRT